MFRDLSLLSVIYITTNIKNNVYDDGLYLHKDSKIYRRFTSCLQTCPSVWTGEVFKLPGSGNQDIKLSTAELNKVISDRTKSRETSNYSAMFMEKKEPGIGYARQCGVDHTSWRNNRLFCYDRRYVYQ